jgi:hypothetical protein
LRQELGQLPEVLRGGSEVELVSRTVGTPEPQSVEAQMFDIAPSDNVAK